MRLTCPNCAATYEVDDRVIPMGGRDVQCSNCGQAWFQLPAGAEFTQAPEPEADLPFEDATTPLPEAPAEDLQELADPAWPDLAADLDLSGSADLSPEAEAALAAALDDTAPPPAPAGHGTGTDWPAEEWPNQEWPNQEWTEDQTSVQAETAISTAPGEMPASGLAAPTSPPPPRAETELRRRSIDEAVLNVLREEAEREVRARRSPTPGIEMQAELPLAPASPPRRDRPAPADPEPVQTASDATERAATLRGEDPELEAEIAAASRPPRRELLPDIEEINSTLRATSERGREAAALDAPETLRRRRSGFRLGFGLSLAMAMVLLGLYLGAPRLATQIPAAAPALAGYVAAVDRGRIWLDRTIAAQIDALTTAE